MNRNDLIMQLHNAFNEETYEAPQKVNGIDRIYTPATGSIRFVLNGTDYSMEDLNAAADILENWMQTDTRSKSHRFALEVSYHAIMSLISQFVEKESTFAAPVKVGRSVSDSEKHTFSVHSVEKPDKDESRMRFISAK